MDPKSGHGFGSSKPVVMWDTKTLATIKTIDVEGGPDGILFDPFNERVYIFSHRAPNATVINAADGSIAGTIDLGGAPEQAVTDGHGHLYVDIEDKDNIAVVDAKTMTVTAHYDLAGKCGGPGGLAFDVKNHVLFAACHEPHAMVILSSVDGKIITSSADWKRRGWRDVQSGHDGSIQLAVGRDVDGDKGKQPDRLRGRADRADDAEREDADVRPKDRTHFADRCGFYSRARTETGRTPPARGHGTGYVQDFGGGEVALV